MSTASEKANLARIRDNQRRSRARRKEYLQELESRLRQCELQGIEASSEIQVAARRVADENKKLRVLLLQNGVSEDSIDAYVQSSPTSDTTMSNSYGNTSGALHALEQLLFTRKAFSANDSPPKHNVRAREAGSRDSSVSTVQSGWDSNDRRRSGGVQQSSQILTPTSMASRTSSVSVGQGSNQGIPHHQRVPVQMPQNLNRHSPTRISNLFDYDSQFTPSNTSYNSQPTQIHNRSSSYNPSTSFNVNSCVFATDMITTMAGGDPSTVRADLGCLPGMDCDVDNHLVFNVMDRYTGVNL